MRICYVVLSSDFGRHQYTGDLANRFALTGHDVHVVTTAHAPRDRYVPRVMIDPVVTTADTGFSLETLDLRELHRIEMAIMDLNPDLVHFSGPHVWNLPLLRRLRSYGVPTIHTLYDLDLHESRGPRGLARMWNNQILSAADHILVHADAHYEWLAAQGFPAERLTSTPLLHLFVGGSWVGNFPDLAASVEYQPWALFFGRLQRNKGIEYLVSASAMMRESKVSPNRVVIAGAGDVSSLWAGALPKRLEIRNYLIGDEEAMDLFCRCGLLCLPYVDATQSSLIAAAYYFRKPVLVTRSGALPEYVEEDRTGRIVEPSHPPTLARALEAMLADPEGLRRMGEAGRAWYDAHRAAEEEALLQVYTNLASQRVRPRGAPMIAALEG